VKDQNINDVSTLDHEKKVVGEQLKQEANVVAKKEEEPSVEKVNNNEPAPQEHAVAQSRNEKGREKGLIEEHQDTELIIQHKEEVIAEVSEEEEETTHEEKEESDEKEAEEGQDGDEEEEEEEEEEEIVDVKYSEGSSHSSLLAASVSLKGRREHNEDRSVVNTSLPAHPNISVFAVFDGHDGAAASSFCSKNLVKFVTTNKLFSEDMKLSLTQGFLKTDQKFLEKLEDSGTTAVVAVVTDEKVFVANTGDSRCVVSVAGVAKALSRDHKPNLKDELARIEATGRSVEESSEIVFGKRVKVARIDGKLAVSRAIGDAEYKDDPSAEPAQHAVTAVPEIQEIEINQENPSFLVLACDGLWDVMTNQEVVDFVATRIGSATTHEQLMEVAKELVENAISTLGSSDNVTVVLVKF